MIMKFAFWCCVLCFFCGCFTSPRMLSREQGAYAIGTNAVGVIERYVVPAVPEPYRVPTEAALALATAGLAAWNAFQQKHLRLLRNGLEHKAAAATPEKLGP